MTTSVDNADSETRSIARWPEARFAWVAGLCGGLLAAAISVKAIFSSASSTAALGFIFVPFLMAFGMVIAGTWGFAIGCLWYAYRGVSRHYGLMLALAAIIGLGVPTYAGWRIYQGLALQRAVASTVGMDAATLEHAMAQSPWRDNRFFIGAVAQNKAASEALLDRMADLPLSLPQAELYEPLGSLWDVHLDNRKGLAAMRLLVLNPNVGATTLARLAQSPQSDKVIGDILRNVKTPMTVLARYLDSTDPNIEWGLALNPNLPVRVMERIAMTGSLYARFNLTYNAATPIALLELLTKSTDVTLAKHAQQALDRRASRTSSSDR